jgi:hypothetical protein
VLEEVEPELLGAEQGFFLGESLVPDSSAAGMCFGRALLAKGFVALKTD